MFWIGLIIGLLAGGTLGFIGCALLVVAGQKKFVKTWKGGW